MKKLSNDCLGACQSTRQRTEMEFPGRAKIISQIESRFEEQGSGILILYGERGMGKTTLLQAVAKKFPSVYYHAVPASGPQQARLFMGQLGEEKWRPAADCRDAFFCLTKRYRQQKVLLIIDEFDCILRADEYFSQELRILLNHGYSDTDFLVILSSSSLGFIANAMGKKLAGCAPLIRGTFKLRALSFSDACLLMKDLEPRDRFAAYALFGGNPLYLSAACGYRGYRQMICGMFFREPGLACECGLRSISGELREPNVYATILYAIASGKTKLNEIHLATGFGRAKISVYLKNLMELDLVEKVYSYGSAPRDDSKKGVYRIANPAVAFWYRFFYDRMGDAQRMQPEEFFDRWIADRLDAFWEHAYADVVAQALCEGKISGLPRIVRCGEWIGKSGEIPVVAVTDEERAIPVFVRPGGERMTAEDAEWYAFSCKKAGLDPEEMLLFSENEEDAAITKNGRVYSFFASVS